MKYATLMLGLAILVASIVAARAEMLYCSGRWVAITNDEKGIKSITVSELGNKPLRLTWSPYKPIRVNGKRCKFAE